MAAAAIFVSGDGVESEIEVVDVELTEGQNRVGPK